MMIFRSEQSVRRRVPCFVIALGLAVMLAPEAATAQKTHRLPATPQTVAYGYYWSEAKPALTIASGDIIDVETLLTNTPTGLERAGVAPAEIQQSLRDIVGGVTGTNRGPGGHILTGPVFVTGADSGDVLEVKILAVDLAIPYGYNGCSGFVRALCDREGARTRIIRLDQKRMVGTFAPGIEVPLRPFFGSMGVAPPPTRGRVSSNPPDIHAGNLDNKELVAGTTLYIPVHVKGALFEVGDGHAAQGDGEVDQTGIETSLRGRLQLSVRKDMKLEWPRGETATHWITMGMDTSLTTATRIAIEQMTKLITEKKGLTQMEAYQLASIAADLRITQLVDGNMGVHMMIAKSLIGDPRRER
jgi:acetamidase/formamidase